MVSLVCGWQTVKFPVKGTTAHKGIREHELESVNLPKFHERIDGSY